MNEQQKQRTLQILRRFEQANPMTRQADNAAVDMASLLRELIVEQPASVPDGWKLTPVGIAPEMYIRGAEVLHDQLRNYRTRAEYETHAQQEIAGSIFEAMLTAAPAAPEPDPEIVRKAWRTLEPYLGKDVPDSEVVLLSDVRGMLATIAAEKGVQP